MHRDVIKSHVALGTAMVVFGLMAPLAKDATSSGLTGLQLATLRIGGAAVLFWLAAPFVSRQRVERRDLPRIAAAGLLGVAICQSALVVGISLTSPVNASIEVTSQPIFAMLLAAVLMGEPLTWRKAVGVLLGCAGAVILITQVTDSTGRATDLRGDLIILGGQVCFALYLTLFRDIIRRYNIFVLNRWMFTFAALALLPFTWRDMAALPPTVFTPRTLCEVGYIIVFCTFITFTLVVYSQRHLRPTVVSTYNYVQPVVTVAASLTMGVATFSPWQAVASMLVFAGVWLVVTSRAKSTP